HRFVWTTIFLLIVLSWQRRWPELIANVRSPRERIYCLTGGLAIASNWFLFIYAVNTDRVVESSLGYFMTPLMNVLFGAIFLRVFLYHEPFTRGHLVTFVLIWLALALFTGEAVLRWRSSRVRAIATCALEASALD